MISKYFSYHHNFNDIVKNDPAKNNGPEYWNLKYFPPNENWCWNTNIFTEKELDRIIVIGKRLFLQRAQTGGNGEDCLDHRRSFVSWIGANSETDWIFKKLTDAAIGNNNQFWNYDLDKIERLQFTQYLSEENGTYHAHVDPMSWNNSHNRKLSMSLQLSDPSNYEGGDVILHLSHNPTIISKERGLAVFFPSHTLHEVTPVTKGERYSLVAWFHGPNLR